MEASCMGVSGGDAGRESGNGVSTTGASAGEGLAVSDGVGSGVAAALPTGITAASTAGSDGLSDPATAATEAIAPASGASLKDALIGVAVFSTPSEPKTPSLTAPQPARAHSPTNATKRRGLITQALPALELKAHP